ncbi:RNA polymerase sigma factor [Pendulispora rubella]|uniref:RNA polymerase sigma factor n=1 Tax=Pendulispora rubella TaxID=2741070 RepID=A0ABZ2L1A8_9BACT
MSGRLVALSSPLAQADVAEADDLPPESKVERPRQSGIDLSFRALYEKEVDFIWRNLRRLGVPEADLEDKTQEVFVVAHRRFAEFVDRGFGARAWLFQIALRVAADTRRHRRRHPEDADGGAAMARQSIEADQTGSISRRERLARLDRALASIQLDKRAVLVLYEIEEQTAPEIARALGISVNTVYSRLRVARAELELALKRDLSPLRGGA